MMPAIPGIEHCIQSDDFFELEEIPKRRRRRLRLHCGRARRYHDARSAPRTDLVIRGEMPLRTMMEPDIEPGGGDDRVRGQFANGRDRVARRQEGRPEVRSSQTMRC